MKKNRAIVSFLLGCMVLAPMTATAANNELTREQMFSAPSASEKEYEKFTTFEKTILEAGREYQLKKVDYEVLSTEYLDKKEKKIDSQVMPVGQDYEPSKTLDVGKETYKLKETREEKKVMEEAYEQTVNAFEDYQYAATKDSVPATKTVTATNEKTGQPQSVVCSFSGISNEGTNTITNNMTITYSDYDASYYEWNGNLIPKNDDEPALKGYEAQLLSSVNAGEGSTITNIAWAGDVYQDADGTACRDAVATVQQVVPIYRANYVGTIHTPTVEGIVYHATYEGDDLQGRVTYNVRATALYKEKEMPKAPILRYVLTGVGITILLAAVVVILMILSKRRKERKTWNN